MAFSPKPMNLYVCTCMYMCTYVCACFHMCVYVVCECDKYVDKCEYEHMCPYMYGNECSRRNVLFLLSYWFKFILDVKDF